MERIIKSDSVKKNMLYQTSYQLLSIILPFATAPYIARVLGTKGVGIYSLTNSITYFFVIFANLGISNYGNREIAINTKSEELLSKTFCEIFFCHFLISVVSILAYAFYITFNMREYRFAFFCQGIQLLSALIDITWFFAGIQLFKITVLRNLIVRSITLISIFAFVKNGDDVCIYIIIMATGNFIGYCILWIQLQKFIHFVRISVKDALLHLKPMFVLFLPIIAMSIYRHMDKIMIPFFSNIDELGLYENSEKIIMIPLSFITSIGVVLLPKISSLVSTGDKEAQSQYFSKSIVYSMILAFGLCGGLIAIAPVFAPVFFGENFRRCDVLISLLSITVLFLTWSNTIRSHYLIPYKKDFGIVFATILGAVINIVLNSFLITLYGAKGAVFATITTEAMVALIHSIYSLNVIDYKEILIKIIPYSIPTVVMILLIRISNRFLDENLFTLISQCLLGAVFYLFSACVFLRLQDDVNVRKLIFRKR